MAYVPSPVKGEGAFVFRLNDNRQGPDLVRQVFLERGWVEFDEDQNENDDWNLYWKTSRFRASDYDVVHPWQRLNHFPKSVTITKKDCLARNLKRMKGIYGNGVYNFSPAAFNLPNDYTKFVSEYTRLRQTEDLKTLLWICKPADMSRGRGIFLFRELSDLQYDCSAVVQRYISNPLLIGGYKFDLRIYVVVPSFQPLVIYIYQEGLVRFSTEKFNLDSLNNIFSHLTNTSINKHSPEYTADKERVGPGCKWTVTQLRHYFHQNNIDDGMLFARIANIVVLTLIMQAPQVPKVNNCFELYGFDILIDENLKPWLLEVNFSPSLSMDCQLDSAVKKPLIHDLLDMMKFKESDKKRKDSLSNGSDNQHASQYRNNQATRRRSLVSRQKTASLKNFSNFNMSQFSGSYGSVDLYHEPVYCSGEPEDGVRHIADQTTGSGLPIVKNREDINRERSDSSGFSSCSSLGTQLDRSRSESARSKSPVGLETKKVKDTAIHMRSDHREKRQQENRCQPKRHSKVSVNSDSAVSSGSERSQDARNKHMPLSINKKTAQFKMCENSSESKFNVTSKWSEEERPLISLKPSASSPVLHKISAQWSSLRRRPQVKLSSQVHLMSYRSTDTLHLLPQQFDQIRSKTSQTLGRQKGNISYPRLPKNYSFATCDSHLYSLESPSNSIGYSAKGIQRPLRRLIPSVKSPPKTGPPLQVGNYFLVFPLNDGTKKASKPVLDVRSAVLESQKLLKKSLMEIKAGTSAKHKLDPQVTEQGEKLWGPVRLPETGD